jgi:hypothetical protein
LDIAPSQVKLAARCLADLEAAVICARTSAFAGFMSLSLALGLARFRVD